MNYLASSIKQEDIDVLLGNVTVSPSKLNKFSTELTELCKESNSTEAFKYLVDHCSRLFISNSQHDTSFGFSAEDNNRIYSQVDEIYKNDNFNQESLNLLPLNPNVINLLLKAVAHKDNDIVLARALTNISFIKESLETRKSDNRKSLKTKKVDEQNLSIDFAKDLPLFLSHLLQCPDLKSFLVVMKLFLSLWEDNAINISEPIIPTISLQNLQRNRLLGKPDFSRLLHRALEVEHLESFKSCLRILPLQGKPEILTLTEIQGQSSGIISGVKLSKDSNVSYFFEVTINNEPSHTRIGWTNCNRIFNNSSSIGDDRDSWIFECRTQGFFHDSSNKSSKPSINDEKEVKIAEEKFVSPLPSTEITEESQPKSQESVVNEEKDYNVSNRDFYQSMMAKLLQNLTENKNINLDTTMHSKEEKELKDTKDLKSSSTSSSSLLSREIHAQLGNIEEKLDDNKLDQVPATSNINLSQQQEYIEVETSNQENWETEEEKTNRIYRRMRRVGISNSMIRSRMISSGLSQNTVDHLIPDSDSGGDSDGMFSNGSLNNGKSTDNSNTSDTSVNLSTDQSMGSTLRKVLTDRIGKHVNSMIKSSKEAVAKKSIDKSNQVIATTVIPTRESVPQRGGVLLHLKSNSDKEIASGTGKQVVVDKVASKSWAADTVIGCLLNTTTRTLRFFVNGEEYGDPAFSNLEIDEVAGCCPAFSCDAQTKLSFNFGDVPYKYPYQPVAIMDTTTISTVTKQENAINESKLSQVSCKSPNCLTFGISTSRNNFVDESTLSLSSEGLQEKGDSNNTINIDVNEHSISNDQNNIGYVAVKDFHPIRLPSNFTIELSLRFQPVTSNLSLSSSITSSSSTSTTTTSIPTPVSEKSVDVDAVVNNENPQSVATATATATVGNQYTLLHYGRELPSTSVTGGFSIFITDDGSITFDFYGLYAYKSRSGLIIPNRWIHLAILFSIDSFSLTFVIDGILVECVHPSVKPTYKELPMDKRKPIDNLLSIGAKLKTTNTITEQVVSLVGDSEYLPMHGWQGDICEVRFWSDVRHVENIRKHRGRSKLIGTESHLIAYWRFEDGCSNRLADCCFAGMRPPYPGIIVGKGVEWSHIWSDAEYTSIIPSFNLLNASDASSHTESQEVEICGSIFSEIITKCNSKDNYVSLPEAIASISSIQLTSCTNYLNPTSGGNERHCMRSIQRKTPVIQVVESPHVLNFLLINSSLRQLSRMIISNTIIDETHRKLLLSLVVLYLRFLRINLSAVIELKFPLASLGLIYSKQINDKSKSMLNSLLIILQYYVNADHAFDTVINDTTNADIRHIIEIISKEAVQTIMTGFEIFFPHATDRTFLLECLLILRHRNNPKVDVSQLPSELMTLIHHYGESKDIRTSLNDSLKINEPLIGLLILSDFGLQTLLSAVCLKLSEPRLTSGLVPKVDRPISAKTMSAVTCPSEEMMLIHNNSITPLSGDLVFRGPHWTYENQDGGAGSIGMVVHIIDWMGETDRGLEVQWSNGSMNTYSWGAIWDNESLGKFPRSEPKYEVSILRPADESQRKESEKSQTWEEEAMKRNLKYTPEEVYNSLVEEVGELTKRAVLRYMKENAPERWKVEHHLNWTENTLVSKLTVDDISILYEKFYNTFSFPDKKISRARLDTLNATTIYNQELLEDEDVVPIPSPILLRLLIREVEAEQHLLQPTVVYGKTSSTLVDSCHDPAARLLGSLQGLYVGTYGNRYKDPDVKNYVTIPKVSERICSAGFSGHDSTMQCWDMEFGVWKPFDQKHTSSSDSDTGNPNSNRNHPSSGTVHYHRDLLFDLNWKAESLKITDHGRTIRQTANRQWSTCLMSTGIRPRTGIHRWFFTIPNLSKRGHCVFGVCTREQKLNESIGLKMTGWGISSDRELFHGGRLRDDFGHKFSVGMVLQVVLDTDQGTLGFYDMNSSREDMGIAFAFESYYEHVLYPAVSLFSEGDTITILRKWGKNGIDSMNGDLKDTSKSLSTANNVHTLFPVGAPCKTVIAYTLELITSATDLILVCREDACLMSHPLLSVHLSQLLAALSRWQFMPHRKLRKPLFNAMKDFLELLNDWIVDFSETFDNNFDNSSNIHATDNNNNNNNNNNSSENSPIHGNEIINTTAPSAIDIEVKKVESNNNVTTTVDVTGKSLQIQLGNQLICIISTYISLLVRATAWESRDTGECNNEQVALVTAKYYRSPEDTIEAIEKNKEKKYSLINQSNLQKIESYRNWVHSPLFSNGLRSISRDSTLRDGYGTPVTSFLPPSCWLNNGSEGDLLIAWLESHDVTNLSIRKLGGGSLTRSTRQIFYAMLYHSGYLSIAKSIANQLLALHNQNIPEAYQTFVSKRPSFFLSHFWHEAEQIRVWVRLLNQENKSSYELLGYCLVARAEFLLHLAPWKCEMYIPIESTIANASEIVIKDSFIKKLEEDIKEVADAVISFTKDYRNSLTKLEVSLKTVEVRACRRLESMIELRQLFSSQLDRLPAGAKSAFLLHFPLFLPHGSLSLYSPLSPNNVTTNSTETSPSNSNSPLVHYLNNLQGASTFIRKSIRGAFQSLYQSLANEMTTATSREDFSLQLMLMNCWGIALTNDDHDCLARVDIFSKLQDIIGDTRIELTPPAAQVGLSVTLDSSSEVIDPRRSHILTAAALKVLYLLALQIAASENSEVKSQYRHSTLLPLKPVKLERCPSGPMTLSVSVFNILFAELESVASTLLTLYRSGSTSLVNVQKIATTNTTTTSATAATTATNSSTTTTATAASSSTSYQGIRISRESLLVLEEATALLSCVTHTVNCQRILCQPKWIVLLLGMSQLCPGVCHQRTLRLLSSLLPLMELQLIETTGTEILQLMEKYCLDTTTYKSNDDQAVDRIIDILLHLAAIVPVDWESEPPVPIVYIENEDVGNTFAISALPIAAEAVAVLRKLLQTKAWNPIIEKRLLKYMSLLTPAAWKDELLTLQQIKIIIAAFYVLGGLIDVPYPGSPVLIQEVDGYSYEKGVLISFHEGAESGVQVVMGDGSFGITTSSSSMSSSINPLTTSSSTPVTNLIHKLPFDRIRGCNRQSMDDTPISAPLAEESLRCLQIMLQSDKLQGTTDTLLSRLLVSKSISDRKSGYTVIGNSGFVDDDDYEDEEDEKDELEFREEKDDEEDEGGDRQMLLQSDFQSMHNQASQRIKKQRAFTEMDAAFAIPNITSQSEGNSTSTTATTTTPTTALSVLSCFLQQSVCRAVATCMSSRSPSTGSIMYNSIITNDNKNTTGNTTRSLLKDLLHYACQPTKSAGVGDIAMMEEYLIAAICQRRKLWFTRSIENMKSTHPTANVTMTSTMTTSLSDDSNAGLGRQPVPMGDARPKTSRGRYADYSQSDASESVLQVMQQAPWSSILMDYDFPPTDIISQSPVKQETTSSSSYNSPEATLPGVPLPGRPPMTPAASSSIGAGNVTEQRIVTPTTTSANTTGITDMWVASSSSTDSHHFLNQSEQDHDNSSSNNNNSEAAEQLSQMGFPRAWCDLALNLSRGDVNEALTFLLTNGDTIDGMLLEQIVMQVGENDNSGDPVPIPIPNSETHQEGDVVVEEEGEEEYDEDHENADIYLSELELFDEVEAMRNQALAQMDAEENHQRQQDMHSEEIQIVPAAHPTEPIQDNAPHFNIFSEYTHRGLISTSPSLPNTSMTTTSAVNTTSTTTTTTTTKDDNIVNNNPNLYHFDCTSKTLGIIYSLPSLASERIAALFPGDDVIVYGEFSGSLGNHNDQWLKVKLSDFIDEEGEEEEEEDESPKSTTEQLGNVEEDEYGWVQRFRNDKEVLLPGSTSGVVNPLNNPPSETFRVRAVYRIVGTGGAMLRSGLERSSDVIQLLKCGDIVLVTEETFNMEGTLRLKVVVPTTGYISKVKGLVKKISVDDRAWLEVSEENLSSITIDKSTKTTPEKEIELLRCLPDHWEKLGGAENYKKEDRLFGVVQEKHFQFSSSGKENASVKDGNRRSRVMGNSGNSFITSNRGMVKSLSTLSPSSLDERIFSLSHRLSSLRCRETLLISFARGMSQILDTSNNNNNNINNPHTPIHVPEVMIAMFSSVVVGDDVTKSEGNTLSLPPVEDTTPQPTVLPIEGNSTTPIPLNSLEKQQQQQVLLASDLVSFFRLICFRGDPFTDYDVQSLVLDAVTAAGLNSYIIKLEVAIGVFLQLSLSKEIIGTVESLNSIKFSQFQNNVIQSLLIEICKCIRIGCSTKYNDQSFIEVNYHDDVDDELSNIPNMHFAQWATKILITTKQFVVMKDLFQVWLFALKGASMSLKQIAFTVLSDILLYLQDTIQYSEERIPDGRVGTYETNDIKATIDLFVGCLQLLPCARLRIFSVHRYWFELEDHPAYSRFLQALLQLLSVVAIAMQYLLSKDIDSTVRVTLENLQKELQGDQLQVNEVTSLNTSCSSNVDDPNGSAASTASRRPVITFSSNGESNIQLDQPKELKGPWTIEFWIYRDEIDNSITTAIPTVVSNTSSSIVCQPPVTSGEPKPAASPSAIKQPSPPAKLAMKHFTEWLSVASGTELISPSGTRRPEVAESKMSRRTQHTTDARWASATSRVPSTYCGPRPEPTRLVAPVPTHISAHSPSFRNNPYQPIDMNLPSNRLVPDDVQANRLSNFTTMFGNPTNYPPRGRLSSSSTFSARTMSAPPSVQSRASISASSSTSSSTSQVTSASSSMCPNYTPIPPPPPLSHTLQSDTSEDDLNMDFQLALEMEREMDYESYRDSKNDFPNFNTMDFPFAPQRGSTSTSSSSVSNPFPTPAVMRSTSLPTTNTGGGAAGGGSRDISNNENTDAHALGYLTSPFDNFLGATFNSLHTTVSPMISKSTVATGVPDPSGPIVPIEIANAFSQSNNNINNDTLAPFHAIGLGLQGAGSRSRAQAKQMLIRGFIGSPQSAPPTMKSFQRYSYPSEDKSGVSNQGPPPSEDKEQGGQGVVPNKASYSTACTGPINIVGGLPPIYLVSSHCGFIKIMSGGRLPPTTGYTDPLQEDDYVEPSALCFSVGHQGEEKVFDYKVPCGRWVHIALCSKAMDRSADKSVVLLVDGEKRDTVNLRLNLPLTTIGSTRKGQSFRGQLAEIRIWSVCRSEGEIKRDMYQDVRGAKYLTALLRCMEGSGNKTIDESEFFNCCTLSDAVSWQESSDAPKMRKPAFPPFLLEEAEEAEGIFGEKIGRGVGLSELTGLIRIIGNSGMSGELSRCCAEVVRLCYRTVHDDDKLKTATTTAASASTTATATTTAIETTKEIEGYLEWCDRSVRSQMTGTLTPEGKMTLRAIDICVVGPPEQLEWLSSLTFIGLLNKDGDLSGRFLAVAKGKPQPAIKVGSQRIDESSLTDEMMVQREPSNTRETISLPDNDPKHKEPPAIGGIITIQVNPNTTQGNNNNNLPTITDFLAYIDKSKENIEILNQTMDVKAMKENWDKGCRQLYSNSNITEVVNATTPIATTSTSTPSFGLCCGDGVYLTEWNINHCSSDSISIGVCDYSYYMKQIYRSNSSIKQQLIQEITKARENEIRKSSEQSKNDLDYENVWLYRSDGTIQHGSERHKVESYRGGNIIKTVYDANCGILSFFKDDVMIIDFHNVFSSNSSSNKNDDLYQVEIDVGNSQQGIGSTAGLRPFALIGAASDSITFSGHSTSDIVKLRFPHSDFFGRSLYYGQVDAGNWHGRGILKYHDSNGYWCGMWWKGIQHGIQIWVEDNKENEKEIDKEKEKMPDEGINNIVDQKLKVMEQKEGSTGNIPKAIAYLFDHGISVGEIPVEVAQPWIDEWNSTLVSGNYSQYFSLTISNCISEKQQHANNDLLSMDKKRTWKKSKATKKPHNTSNDSTSSSSYDSASLESMSPPSKSSSGHVTNGDLSRRQLIELEATAMSSLQKLLLVGSTTPYILQIIYIEGATARTGVEIDESLSVSVVPFGTVLEGFEKSYTRDGIVRYKTKFGWISEKLRSASQETVVHILREILPRPIKYSVIREGGAKMRKEAEMHSEESGVIKKDSIISVLEKRLVWDNHPDIEDPNPSATVMRLCVATITETTTGGEVITTDISACQGWVSEKANIVKAIPPDEMELSILAEIKRRSMIRSHRDQLKSVRELSSSLGNRVDVIVRGTLEASTETFFLISKRSATQQGAKISSDFTSVHCESGNSSRCTVLGSKGFTKGVHYWEVKVVACQWGSVFIGVAPKDSHSWLGYGFVNYRATQAFGNETLYGCYYKEGDIVGIQLDMDHGTITFVKDGEDSILFKPVVVNMGIAYRSIRKSNKSSTNTFYPCFGMKASGDRLSIRHCRWMSQHGLSPETRLSQYLAAKRVLASWECSYHYRCLPQELLKEMYGAYQGWCKDDMLLLKSRAGLPVAVDIRKEALMYAGGYVAQTYDLYTGKRFWTKYGNAQIVGARKKEIWYRLETNDVGCWYWTLEDLFDLLAQDMIRFHHTEGKNSEEMSPSVPHSPQDSGLDLPMLTIEEFNTQFTNRLWTSTEDECIVKLVNKFADKNDTDPLRISGEQLESQRILTELLPHRTSKEIQARYVALCVLNKALAVTLPLIDFARQSYESPMITDYDHKFMKCFTNKLSLHHPRHLDNCDIYLSSAARQYSNLKRAVFTRTKLNLWGAAIAETVTLTIPPADEYERPDDIREISLNRLEAQYSRALKEDIPLEDRLQRSLFGQLREAIRGWDDKLMRRSFVHMQDAGQARAFFVKFTGEGVDDHGGPYRAAFETAAGEEPVWLELLVPCPNSKNDMGNNRDQLIFNSNFTKNSKLLLLFHHLGKLVGIANRHSILLPLPLPQLIWKPLVGEIVTTKDLKSVDTYVVNSLQSISNGDIRQEDVPEMLCQILETLTCTVSDTVIRTLHQEFINMTVEYETSFSNREVEIVSESSNSSSSSSSSERSQYIVNTKSDEQRIQSLCELFLQLEQSQYRRPLQEFLRGLCCVLPMELAALFTPSELEILFCGQPEVDIEMLKRVTEYDGVSPDEKHIQYFWEAVQLMSTEDKAQFINFCSGHTRLPSSAADFPMNFKLTYPPSKSSENPDEYLPIAQTCFFSLSLPKYSSVQVCLEKLKYAIHNANLMDADFNIKNAVGWENIR